MTIKLTIGNKIKNIRKSQLKFDKFSFENKKNNIDEIKKITNVDTKKTPEKLLKFFLTHQPPHSIIKTRL